MAPAPVRREALPADTITASAERDIKLVVRELAGVAEYISRLKREIGALRVHELCEDRIPEAHQELGIVVKATASASNHIMTAAEEILGTTDDSLERY